MVPRWMRSLGDVFGENPRSASDERERRRRIKDRRRNLYTLLFGAAVVLVVAAYLILEFLIYHPYETFTYETVPPMACEGESVVVEVERIPSAADQRADYYVANPRWVPKDASKNQPVILPRDNYSIVDNDGPEVSQAVTAAPRSVGVWTLRVEIDVIGHIGPIPVSQDLTVTAVDSLEILPVEDPRCTDIAEKRSRA